jgi:hypothetical protein
VDSFQGLSAPHQEDLTRTDQGMVYTRAATGFASDSAFVRDVLSALPDVSIHAGWIPPVLKTLPDEPTYLFVHLDTDLFEPTLACLTYFVPRMLPGGAIVDDDYGSMRFPGVAKAWDRAAEHFGLKLQVLDTGQVLLTCDRP